MHPRAIGCDGCRRRPTAKISFAGATRLSHYLRANLDFEQLVNIAALGRRRNPPMLLQIEIPESPGAMLALSQQLPASTNIRAFQYGKTQRQVAFLF